LRKKGGTTDYLPYLGFSLGGNDNSRANPVSVALGADKLDCDPVIPVPLVVVETVPGLGFKKTGNHKDIGV